MTAVVEEADEPLPSLEYVVHRTARAGSDYRAARGTLTFAPGETVKTVSVLDDAVDEGKERFVLHLSNALGARIADGEVVGAIANSDPIPKAWIARFGRAVADQVVDGCRKWERRTPYPLTHDGTVVASR